MADRTSAALFAELFEYLAQDESCKARKMAEHIWEMADNYDFCARQMCCDEALLKLGLAHEGINEDGEDGILYKGGR